MSDEVKGYEGNKGMSKEDAAKRLEKIGGLEALGFGSQPLPPIQGPLEANAPKVAHGTDMSDLEKRVEALDHLAKSWQENPSRDFRTAGKLLAMHVDRFRDLLAPREEPGHFKCKARAAGFKTPPLTAIGLSAGVTPTLTR